MLVNSTRKAFSKKAFIALLIISNLFGCKSPDNGETASTNGDSPSDTESLSVSPVYDGEGPEKPDNFIQYDGVAEDENWTAMQAFPLLSTIFTLSRKTIDLKDSLENVRAYQENPQDLTKEDSALYAPAELAAYNAILEYIQTMASGLTLDDRYYPGLLTLKRNTRSDDSSFSVLPHITPSAALADKNFFFLGGSPFIDQLATDETRIYHDADGNPESRFSTDGQENCSFLLNAIYHARKTPTKIKVGPPLGSYDMGPQEIKGIGSLVHQFADRIPVWLLTEEGAIPASLINVEVKIVPEGLGCVSDQPKVQFACSQNLSEFKILGVFIPMNDMSLKACKVTWEGNRLWTADINDDGIPDFAAVHGTFGGNVSDVMAETLWFVNINGEWKIIDAASDLDCT
jgi:hypothetical protein